VNRLRLHCMLARSAVCAIAMTVMAAQSAREIVADRVVTLTRNSPWRQVEAIKVGFRTYHPQGLVRIGDHFFVSSVEVREAAKRFARPVNGYDRDTGAGVGHLFKVDLHGRLVAEVTLGEGTMYHPGGIDYDGTHLWVPVAEYRPDSRSIIYRVDPQTLAATPVLRFADHIGAIVHDVDARTLHGVSWGSRRFYRWTLDTNGRVTNAGARPASLRTLNPSHYIDYQDCQYAGRSRMICGGVSELSSGSGSAPFRLGGLELIDLEASRPIHQVPVLLWTQSGLDMTHNPVWLEATPSGLRAYFMPEDDDSTLYVYEVTTP
jgi:hypothetical protein